MIAYPFTKCHGAGNDFVLIDATAGLPLPPDLSAWARFLCDRRLGVGAEGLLLLLPGSTAPFRLRIFNADGSEPALCGNGAYCVACYIDARKARFDTLLLETGCGLISFRKIEEQIALRFPRPQILFPQLLVGTESVSVVNTGVPHAVVFVDALSKVDVEEQGRKIRYAPELGPEGANVNFVQHIAPSQIAVRTYERGVEAETLACGTGVAAAAWTALRLGKVVSNRVEVATRCHFQSMQYALSHTLLYSHLEQEESLEMVGSCAFVFEGTLSALSPVTSFA